MTFEISADLLKLNKFRIRKQLRFSFFGGGENECNKFMPAIEIATIKKNQSSMWNTQRNNENNVEAAIW